MLGHDGAMAFKKPIHYPLLCADVDYADTFARRYLMEVCLDITVTYYKAVSIGLEIGGNRAMFIWAIMN